MEKRKRNNGRLAADLPLAAMLHHSEKRGAATHLGQIEESAKIEAIGPMEIAKVVIDLEITQNEAVPIIKKNRP